MTVTPATYRVEVGVLICSERPIGYFATGRSYRNYVLRFDWKYARPAGLEKDADFSGNRGLLVHIKGEHKVWPTCIEVQLMNRDAGNIFGLGGKFTAKKDAAAQARAITLFGERNRMEVTCKDGAITAKINDDLVAEEREGILPKGRSAGSPRAPRSTFATPRSGRCSENWGRRTGGGAGPTARADRRWGTR